MPEGLKKQVRVSRTSRAAFRQFIQGRLEGGASNAEVNRELAIVKRAFSLGVKEGRLTSKPHIPMLQENNIRSGFFEADALPPYIDCCRSPLTRLRNSDSSPAGACGKFSVCNGAK